MKMSYCGRQTEDGLLSHKPFGEIHIILKIWKVFHIDPNLHIANNETLNLIR